MVYKDVYDDKEVYKAVYLPSAPNKLYVGQKAHRIYSLYIHYRGEIRLVPMNYIRYRKAWYSVPEFARLNRI